EVLAVEGDGGLAGLQDDFFLGEDVDALVGAGDGDAVVGQDGHGVGVGLEADRAVVGDGFEAAIGGVQAGTGAGGGGEAGAGGEVGVALAGEVLMSSGEAGGAVGGGQGQAFGGFHDQMRGAEVFDGRTAAACAVGGTGGILATDRAGVGTVLVRVEVLHEVGMGDGAGQAPSAGLAGGAVEALGGGFGGFQLAA